MLLTLLKHVLHFFTAKSQKSAFFNLLDRSQHHFNCSSFNYHSFGQLNGTDSKTDHIEWHIMAHEWQASTIQNKTKQNGMKNEQISNSSSQLFET